MSHPELRTPHLLLRTPRIEDGAPLTAILQETAVRRFWAGYDRARVEKELLGRHDDTTVLTIESLEAPGEVLGAIQFSQNSDEEYRQAGIDLFLATSHQGRGLGSEAIRAILDHLFDTLGHHRVTIDPSVSNQHAIRTYERLGFRVVGLLRQYERGADGTYHDGLLMELLACDYRARRTAIGNRARAQSQSGAPKLSLRLATEADVPTLLPMMVAFNEFEKIKWDAKLGEAPLRKLLRSPELGRVLLFVTEEPVGYAVVTFGFDLEYDGRDAFLTEIYLVPGVQGLGLGGQAMELLLRDTRSQGAGALHLQVRPDNQHALSLYRAAGFTGTTRLFFSKIFANA